MPLRIVKMTHEMVYNGADVVLLQHSPYNYDYLWSIDSYKHPDADKNPRHKEALSIISTQKRTLTSFGSF